MNNFKNSVLLVFLVAIFQVSGEDLYIKDPKNLINCELSRLQDLIEATKNSLERQEKLYAMIHEYKNIQDEYFKDPQNNEILFQFMKSASRVLKQINESYLTQNFDPEFISELKIISQVAKKKGIPKP